MKISTFFVLALGLLAMKSTAQIIEPDYRPHGSRQAFAAADSAGAVQILKSGTIDFQTDGNVQASAQLLKINIGEKDGFYIPFYFYTGAAGSAFGTDKFNQAAMTNLLNPVGGTFNLSFNGLNPIYKTGKYTSLQVSYQLGGRMVNARDSLKQQNLNTISGLANAGLYFQTGAWGDADPANMGLFFVQVKAIGTFSSAGDLQKVLNDYHFSHSYLLGYSLDAGLSIHNVVNARIGVYQYTTSTASALLKDPVVKLSLDYSMGK